MTEHFFEVDFLTIRLRSEYTVNIPYGIFNMKHSMYSLRKV